MWHIGKVIGLKTFGDDDASSAEMKAMKADLARAKREDKQLLSHDATESRSALHRMFRGQNQVGADAGAHKAIDENYIRENARWMKIVRERFQGSVIRRTVSSLDNKGQPISGLEPYEEHICLLKLYRHEYDALESLAEEAIDGPSFAQRFTSEVSDVLATQRRI